MGMIETTDSVLVERVCGGSDDAATDLFRRHASKNAGGPYWHGVGRAHAATSVCLTDSPDASFRSTLSRASAATEFGR